jgi:hypothetical protein
MDFPHVQRPAAILPSESAKSIAEFDQRQIFPAR